MSFNKNFLDVISNRQIYQNNYLSSKHYQQQITKSIYDPCKLFHIKIDHEKKFYRSIRFSKDDKFLFSAQIGGKIIAWDIDNNISHHFFYKNDEFSSVGLLKIIPCNDVKNLYIKELSDLRIIDLTTFKLLNSYSIFCDFRSNFLINSKNYNIATYSYSSDLVIRDFREKKLQIIPKGKLGSNTICLDNHPSKDHLILVTSEKHGLYSLDFRNYKPDFSYNYDFCKTWKKIYAKYNKLGNQILATSCSSNPTLYQVNKPNPIFKFKQKNYPYVVHESYKNCFAGPDDEYVVTESKLQNFLLWEIPKEKNLEKYQTIEKTKIVDSAKKILKGEKNLNGYKDLCYNYEYSILAVIDNHKLKLCSLNLLNSNSEIKHEKIN